MSLGLVILAVIAVLLAAAALAAWRRERRAARGTQRNTWAIGEPVESAEPQDQATTLRRLHSTPDSR